MVFVLLMRRASVHGVDPEGVAKRRSTAIKRRVYHVSRSNEVWHIDGNHKIIRWRLVVHGGIDGYSCAILFSNGTPTTVVSMVFIPTSALIMGN